MEQILLRFLCWNQVDIWAMRRLRLNSEGRDYTCERGKMSSLMIEFI